MCGIFGHVGSQSSFEKCMEGLKFLEYRGYDSAGIAGVEDGNLICYKERGKLADLQEAIGSKLHRFQSSIGHTRWATHGQASKLNAHPHLDQKSEVALVHNGILENYRALRQMLEVQGIKFTSDTDSEVIAQLISFFYEGDLACATRKAISQMKGFWALAILHKNHPNQIVTTRCENPIVVGVSKENQETFISSDPYAFKNRDLDLYFLENYEIAVIDAAEIQIYDPKGHPIKTEPKRLELTDIDMNKGDFEHYMLKEIMEQPTSIANSLYERFSADSQEILFEDLQLSDEKLREIKEVLILGCGTSWHAGLLAAQQIQELTGVAARAEIASEYRYQTVRIRRDTLVIAISQSGETFDTIAAVRKAKQEGAHILAICNVAGSTLAREAHSTALLRAGPEISVCSTKAFTSQLAVLSLFALKLGRARGMNREQGHHYMSQLLAIPPITQSVLEEYERIGEIAKEVATKSRFLFLGRQYMFPTCLEAALKLKEISYMDATGYPAGELKHGPIALIDPNSVVVALMGNKVTYEKMISNLEEVRARQGFTIAFAPRDALGIEQVADRIIYLPDCIDSLSSFPYAVATQLFAYSIARVLGTEIDRPRNLAKSVTVE